MNDVKDYIGFYSLKEEIEKESDKDHQHTDNIEDLDAMYSFN